MNLQEVKEKHVQQFDIISKLTYKEICKCYFNITKIKELALEKMRYKYFLGEDCFLCEYDDYTDQYTFNSTYQLCDYCPVIWEDKKIETNADFGEFKCFKSYYGELINLLNFSECIIEPKQESIDCFMQNYKTLCEKIRDIEWKE